MMKSKMHAMDGQAEIELLRFARQVFVNRYLQEYVESDPEHFFTKYVLQNDNTFLESVIMSLAEQYDTDFSASIISSGIEMSLNAELDVGSVCVTIPDAKYPSEVKYAAIVCTGNGGRSNYDFNRYRYFVMELASSFDCNHYGDVYEHTSEHRIKLREKIDCSQERFIQVVRYNAQLIRDYDSFTSAFH